MSTVFNTISVIQRRRSSLLKSGVKYVYDTRIGVKESAT